MPTFRLTKSSTKSAARVGTLTTAHGVIKTPFFMPIATKGAIKHLSADDAKDLKSPIILSNTYHLYLQPGVELLKKFGGLHKMMNWRGPILTDSGGFQVFSLSKIRKILPHGVEFQSHLDGSRHTLTPRSVLEIQRAIGSDIAMVLDVCPSSVATDKEIGAAVEKTTAWAQEARKLKNKVLKKSQLLFGIVQGGISQEWRAKSAADLVALDFDGYAIGGLAVGEANDDMYRTIDWTAPLLPKDKPRYLMGVGTPENIVQAVRRGIDMFDCVIPTREARHGRLYLWNGKGDVTKKDFYQAVNITSAKFKGDLTPINNTTLRQYSRGYLHHLFRVNEPLAMRLATINNVDFYLRLMEKIRAAIIAGKL